jgi:predicted MFS family arabinose efflux permease
MVIPLLKKYLPHSYWNVLAHLWSCGIANLASGINVALLTLAAHEFGWSAWQFGSILASGALLRMLLHTQLPYLITRYGNPPRWFMQLGLALTILPLIFWTDNYWFWWVLMNLRGLFTSVSYFNLNTQTLAAAEPHERARVLALYQMTGALWLSMGMTSVIWLGMNWYSFVLIALLSCAAGWIVPQRPAERVELATPGLVGLKNALKQGRVVWGFSILAGLTCGAIAKYLGLYTLARGFDHDQAMLIMSIFVIGGSLAQYPLSALLDTRSKREVTLALLAAAILIVTVMHLTGDNFILMAVMIALWGAIGYVLTPAVQSILGDRFNGPDRLYAMAAHALLFNLGDILGAVTLGFWMDRIGPVAIVYTFMVATALLFILAFKPKIKTLLDQTEFAMWGLNIPLLLKIKPKPKQTPKE